MFVGKWGKGREVSAYRKMSAYVEVNVDRGVDACREVDAHSEVGLMLLPPQGSRARRTLPSCPPTTRCRQELWVRSLTRWAGLCRSKDGLLLPRPHCIPGPCTPCTLGSQRAGCDGVGKGGTVLWWKCGMLSPLGSAGDRAKSPGVVGRGLVPVSAAARAFAGKDSPCTPSPLAAFGTPTPPSP